LGPDPDAAPALPPPDGQSAPRRRSLADRRDSPRIAALSAIDGYGVELDAKVVVREISLGGFSIESPVPFVEGSEHTFLFSTPDGRETLAQCQCRHAHMTEVRGKTVCIAGFQFLPQPAENLKVIVETIERLQHVRQRE
jgi:hypothetical protein